MKSRIPAAVLSALLTAASVAVAAFSVALSRRIGRVQHLTVFNILAAAMLSLVAIALVVSFVSLARARGRGSWRWGAALLALLVLASYLLDE